jgi:hypothetical protein
MCSQNEQQMFAEFQKDPTSYLVKCGLDIPQDFDGDYRALVQHLVNTNQIPPALRGRAVAMLRQNR